MLICDGRTHEEISGNSLTVIEVKITVKMREREEFLIKLLFGSIS